jgi:putative peptide maturation dehydrogenase
MRVRRLERVFFFAEERDHLDLGALLRGKIRIAKQESLFAASPLTGREEAVTAEEVAGLLRIPAGRWTSVTVAGRESGLAPERIRELALRGLLVGDAAEPPYPELRERAERLAADAWDPYAALYHGMARWEGRGEPHDLGEGDEALRASRRWFSEHQEQFGPAPTHLYERLDATARIELPRPERGGGLFDLLARRRTDREFDRSRSLGLDELSTLLRTVYGCQGTLAIADGFVLTRRTSPSGGALHPIEAYPILRDVEGLPSGVYHYATGSHALELLRPMAPAEVEDQIEAIAAGQTYFRSAHAAVVLTARFGRTFWKYRWHKKVYRVVLLDAGHLSQTFYLACAELGLGAFFTSALDDQAAERVLGLDRFREAAVGLSGCGLLPRARRRSIFEPRPFDPRG